MSTEPSPLLTITDFDIERIGSPRPLSGGRVGCAKAAVAVHVCGDGAVRVPELLEAMRAHLLPEKKLACYVRQARAALLVAASQASFVGAVGGALTAGYTNASVASSKKISVADINKLLLLSPMDCYAAGLNNIQRSFDGTFYSGTYGCRVDTGFTMPGLYAHNLRSDKRQHAGNCCLSEEVANELAVEFAKAHWIVFDKLGEPSQGPKYYSAVPTSVRGIPHNFIPGVHSVLNDYCDFIETAREVTERTECDTVDSIHCLPFSAFTQALRPDVEPTADASLRTCFRDETESSTATGRAYLVDSTPEEWAIVKEPLLRRPCQVSSGDCPFATSYDNADTFFNACNTLALLSSCACRAVHANASPTECVEHLHKIVTDLVFGEASQRKRDPCSLVWAADAVLLINVLYPSCLIVGEYALLPAFAKAVPFYMQKLRAEEEDAPPMRGMPLTPDELEEAQAFWAAFRRSDLERCAWTSGLAPFLVTILTHNGSHKTSPEVVAQFKTQLDDAIRAVWCVWSPDGVARPPDGNPASEASSPMHINRHHIDPVFVGDEHNDVMQRAALVGTKPHSYRQVLAEMLGAHIPGVECNVALNEGGMSLRVSSDATILDENGNERTAKSISPIQTEGDESAYGSRRDKINGALRQKKGWDRNALLGKRLYTSIEPPRSAEVRSRGEFGFSHAFQEEANSLREDSQLKPRSYARAEVLVAAAADPGVAKAVNSSIAVGAGTLL